MNNRITISPSKPYADLNIRRQYRIQDAYWISHPDAKAEMDVFQNFELDFELTKEEELTLHVSADQRFELYCNDQYIGMGPDRSDLRRWSFHSYLIKLAAGKHKISAVVHSIHTCMPAAQITHRPAFILASEGIEQVLDTGEANWQVSLQYGISCNRTKNTGDHSVGPDFTINGKNFFAETKFENPIILACGTNTCLGGSLDKYWRLFPSRLPEQTRSFIKNTGKIRMVKELGEHDFLTENNSDDTTPWQALIDNKSTLTIPPNAHITVLWDLDDYQCAYPELTTSKGKDSSIRIEWAEACYRPIEEGDRNKANRNEIEGRRWIGYGDTFIPDGEEQRKFTPFWWRAGRYVKIDIATSTEELIINSLHMIETRLPLENEGVFTCSDNGITDIIPIAVRGIQMCAHETYMDCPYYEQMMYVGDTRLQFLTSCAMSSEDRLNQRALELFNWSRHVTGFVLERHPSNIRQLSTTFSMIWILMLKDGAWWQRYPELIRDCIPGMRSMLEEFRAIRDENGLFTALPGWSFIDWAKGWNHGYPPEGIDGASGVCNLLFLLALQSAFELEKAFGDVHFVASYTEWSKQLSKAIKDKFWDEERSLFADDLDHTYYSEHAQALALLSGQFPSLEASCFEALISAPDLTRTTVYFSFYLHETLTKFGRTDILLEKLDFWKDLKEQGFKTPVEAPEPSRSDCHAWGSHPLFSMHASLCGIRPATPDFTEVIIKPQPASLTELSSKLPHPEGFIDFSMKKQKNEWLVEVSLPENLKGTLEWQGESYPLSNTTKRVLSADYAD